MRAFRVRVVLGVWTFILILPPLASAQSGALDASTLEKLSIEDLLNINVPIYLASQSREDILNSSGTVYVLNETEIRRYGWLNLREILAAIPNVDLVNAAGTMLGGQRGFVGNWTG